MKIRVSWPDGKEREIEVGTLRELDRFVSWHKLDGREVDLRSDGEGLQLVVSPR